MPDTTVPTAPAGPEALSPRTEPKAVALDAVAQELRERLAPRIQLVEKLGEGGFGVVFLGRDPMLHRSVAIKVLSPALARDPDAQERFTREAQAAAAIQHLRGRRPPALWAAVLRDAAH